MLANVNSQSSHMPLFVGSATEEKFLLGIRKSTSSYALEPRDSSGDLQERGWYILEVKARFTLQEAARSAVCSKPIKQRSK